MTYQLDARRDICNQSLSGETVTLSEEDVHGLFDSTFASGTLKLARKSVRSAIVIVRSTIKDSDVIAVKRQRNDHLFQARFINCRFHGVFSGIDFGRSHNVERDGDFGSVEGCDFTDATLDGCRFINVDTSTLRFPTKNHAVLLNPGQRESDVSNFQWPGQLENYMRACTSKPASFNAAVMHIPSLAKLVKCTKDEVRAALEQFGGLLM